MPLHTIVYIMSCNAQILALADAPSQTRTRNFSLEVGKGVLTLRLRKIYWYVLF